MDEFNPHDWLPEHRKKPAKASEENKKHPPTPTGDTAAKVESAIRAIEAAAVDITTTYSQWLEIGFALADEFGEGGREFFHRVSKFHSEYRFKECDEKYSSFLKSKGGGIGIGSFFHHVKAAGVWVHAEGAEGSQRTQRMQENVKPNRSQRPVRFSVPAETPDEEESSEESMPVFPESLYGALPHFLQRVVAPAATAEERDLLLLGSLAALSACFPKLYGIYHGRKVYANIYLFVTAPPSAGKGRLSLCKQLVLPLHLKLRDQAKALKLQYANELAAYNQSDKNSEKPAKPPERMLFIPANNSSTGAFQLLADNEGRGLIFETEGDTLAHSFKSDYGNYSDGFRNAFHHDTISYYRRTDREYVDIESPCISTVLSGTPKQVTALIPSAENGLFSRFLFYYMNLKPTFQDVFADDNSEGMDAYYWQLGKEFLELHETLNHFGPMRITFTQEQKEYFLHYFQHTETRYRDLQPQEYVASVRRLALNSFRMAMVITALRIMEDGEIVHERLCLQQDFDSIVAISKVLVQHSSKVFNLLPEEVTLTKKENLKERFLNALPAAFSTRDFYALAGRFRIPENTARGYISQFVKKGILHREGNGRYMNPAMEQDPKPEDDAGEAE